ncbi:hypothetical protein B0H16DRAFT_1900536 [Mycena metata]|uniref:Uncharacterized protein n=1 Tax=Mycena metata TaxID=1033252 RepID=A0AAD7H4Y5_9AGAR|nr:hypothetical protein B0H16DRAFT_1900536 [Mycena metata]
MLPNFRTSSCYQQPEWTAIADISEQFRLKVNEPECLVRQNRNCRGTNSCRMMPAARAFTPQPIATTVVSHSQSYPMPSYSKLIGFVIVALAMGGVVHAQDILPIPLSFITYADNDGGGASTAQEDVVTGVCYNTGATAHSFKAVQPPLYAYFYRSGDCTHVVGDLDEYPSDITYDEVTNTGRDARSIIIFTNRLLPVPLRLSAYADDGGSGAVTYYNAVTGVCYKTSATVHSVKPEPAPLFYCSYRSGDCTHLAGDGLNQQFGLSYNKVINTDKDAHSLKFFNDVAACEFL